MAQPASLSQEATSCGAKSTGVSGGLGPDPVPPQDVRGSDLGQLPSFLRPPLPHFYCSGLGSKGSVQPRPLGISHLLPISLTPRTSGRRCCLSSKPPGGLSHNHRKGLGRGHSSCPLTAPTPQGPGPAPLIHPTLHS